MLVLARKPGESIVIEGPSTVTVVRLGPNAVRLGIHADSRVAIFRDELDAEQFTPEEQAEVCAFLENLKNRRKGRQRAGQALQEVQVSGA